MKNIDTGSLVVRKYEHGGKQGRFVMCRRTGARCLLEGTAATFFDIASCGSEEAVRRFGELAASFDAPPELIAADYDRFVDGLAHTLSKTDTKETNRILPALWERGITPMVMVELLHPCNLKCFHCYIGHRGNETHHQSRLVRDLPALKARLIEMGCVELTVTGGEIRLVPEILDILSELSRDFIVTALTNGTLWTAEERRRLAALPLKEVRSTLFSWDPVVHDAITMEAGSWLKTLEFITDLKRLGAPVGVNTPVLAANANSVPELVKRLAAEDIEVVVDVTCFQGPGTRDCRASSAQLEPLFRAGIAPRLERRQCVGIRHKVRIGPDGAIFPCEYLSNKLGDIFDGRTMRELRATPLAQGIMAKMASEPAGPQCESCGSKDVCFNCIAFNIAENGDAAIPSSYICDLNRLSGMVAKK